MALAPLPWLPPRLLLSRLARPMPLPPQTSTLRARRPWRPLPLLRPSLTMPLLLLPWPPLRDTCEYRLMMMPLMMAASRLRAMHTWRP